MSHFEDEEGKEFLVLKEGDLLRLTATPEGREQLQRLRAEMGAADDLFKPH